MPRESRHSNAGWIAAGQAGRSEAANNCRLDTVIAAMELAKIIQALIEERHRLNTVIVTLEAIARGSVDTQSVDIAPKRRGRPRMTPAERRQVSERMKKYWGMRQSALASHGASPQAGSDSGAAR